MYIPLDYYRILGLPIQATTEQLRQAHRDRTLQLPRREYSDAAIASRRQLLDEAYGVLASPEQRQSYDAAFLAKTYELAPEPVHLAHGEVSYLPTIADGNGHESPTPSIEIQDDQLVGALLVLQELGEYELVLKLGRPFLTGGKSSLRGGVYGDPEIVYADIVLTVALACLELGREQWQQGQYENAAEALETGQQLLLREGLFAGVRGEVQSDLYKLRPYRVLELLALPEQQSGHLKGLQLLREMLQERGGIDGPHSDHSGLNIDDFLRFIQQLRGYLTAAEQQDLFESEAQRPSAVATYLAVYALIARGFADRQPDLIQRAKQLLCQLSPRQDVHLEQAICTLLLGQTEEASQALELSQEYEPLAFIREQSQGAPDLLPGLCLYSERWLQDEVFPHFRDLLQRRVQLKDYFADRKVQAYLESLPNESEVAEDWSVAAPPSSSSAYRQVGEPAIAAQRMAPPPSAVATSANRTAPTWAEQDAVMGTQDTADALIEVARNRIAARTVGNVATTTGGVVATMPAAERIAAPPAARTGPAAVAPNRRRRDRTRLSYEGTDLSTSGASDRSGDRALRRHDPAKRRRILMIGVAAGVAVLGFLGGPLLLRWVQAASQQAAPPELPDLQLDRPVVALPQQSPPGLLTEATLTTAATQQILESWFAAKAAAMGTEHDTSKLDQILVDPKLSEWRGAAADSQAANSHRQFKHEVKVTAIEQAKDKPDQAVVKADVSEVTEYFDAGVATGSDSDQFPVQYSLVRKEGKWRIENWQVLK